MIVIVDKYGQLGNRLLLFAHFISCAREQHLKILNLAFEDYAQYFETTHRDALCAYPVSRVMIPATQGVRRFLFEASYRAAELVLRYKKRLGFLEVLHMDDTRRCDLGSEEFLALARNHKLLFVLSGWFYRDDSNFKKHAEAIRDFFRPRSVLQVNVDKLVDEVRRRADVLVGVHIRHGDYVVHRGGIYFYETEQYLQIMEKVRDLFPHRAVSFLVCSDGSQPAGCFSGFAVAFGSGHLVEDMYAFAKCDYLVGPPSTYTKWASFYGRVPIYTLLDPDAPVSLENFQIEYVPT